MSSNTELLSIGHQCSHPSCHLVDFLPFKCQHCASPFCASHFRPQAHACEKYDEHAVDRVAPSCPLCNTPVAIPPGEDPNVRMDRHISSECSITTGKTKTSSTPHCAQPRCGKLLFAPIQCSTCKHQYCPAHRFPKDHTCSPPPVLPTSATGKKQPSAASAAALAAFRRTVQPKGKGASPATSAAAAAKPKAKPAAVPVKAAASSSTPTQTPASTAGKGGSKPSAFSKTDRSPAPASPIFVIDVDALPDSDSPKRTSPVIVIDVDALPDSDPPARCSSKRKRIPSTELPVLLSERA